MKKKYWFVVPSWLMHGSTKESKMHANVKIKKIVCTAPSEGTESKNIIWFTGIISGGYSYCRSHSCKEIEGNIPKNNFSWPEEYSEKSICGIAFYGRWGNQTSFQNFNQSSSQDSQYDELKH